MLITKHPQTCRLWPIAKPGDADNLVLLREIDQHRRDARELHLIAMHNRERDPRGNAGVNRIAAGLKHL